MSQATHNTTSGGHQDQVPLTSVSSNEVLRRVIVDYYIDITNPDPEVLITWMQYGVLSLIEATTGSPPPPPDQVGNGLFDYRDILYSQFDTVGNPGIFSGWYRVPGSLDSGHIDVEISRKPGDEPLIIWWNYGLPGFLGAGVEVGFWRCWSRCLLEVTP